MRLAPTRADEVAGLVTFRPTSAANWDFMDATPISGAAGTAQVLFTGQLNTNLAAPSGTNIAPLLPTGDLGPLTNIVPRTPDMLAALNTPSGLLWAANSGSTLYTFKQGLDPAFQISGSIIPGCCGYDPRLGFDTSGRLWLAFYSNSTGAVGEWVGQIDPATGQPVPGTFVKAPQSETPDNNNGHGVGFACAAVCRIAYEQTDVSGISSGRVVTWAPGETPVEVGGAAGGNVESPAIAYRPDGRLWVAWIDRTLDRVVAKLGTGAGASVGGGGTVVNAGRPPKAVADPFLHGLEVVPVGNDLLLNVNAGAGSGSSLTAQFVNLVLEPGAIDTSGIPNPQVTPKSPGGRIVYPGTVTPVELGPNRCVRVKPVADKPARIWAQIFSGRKNGTPVSTRVSVPLHRAGLGVQVHDAAEEARGLLQGQVLPHQVRGPHGRQPEAGREEPPAVAHAAAHHHRRVGSSRWRAAYASPAPRLEDSRDQLFSVSEPCPRSDEGAEGLTMKRSDCCRRARAGAAQQYRAVGGGSHVRRRGRS